MLGYHSCLLIFLLYSALDVQAAAAGAKIASFDYSSPEASAYVTTVTAPTFREHVMDPTVPVVLNFYEPRSKRSKQMGDVIVSVAQQMKEFARFTAVDATTEEGKALGQMFGVQSLPATLLFNPEMLPVKGGEAGQYLKVPVAFGGRPNASQLMRFVIEGTTGHEINILEDLVDYKDFTDQYRMLDIPKFILVTEQKFTSPAFKALAHFFRYGALFGVVHGASLSEAKTAAQGDDPMKVSLRGELLAQLGLGSVSDNESLPVIAVVTSQQDAALPELIPVAGVALPELKSRLAKYAWPEAKRREVMPFFLEDANSRRKRETEDAKKTRALPALVAYDSDTWETHCMRRKRGVCGAVFVENPDDEKLLAWLNSASKQMAQRSSTVPSQLVVISAVQNPELARFFGALDVGLPTVVFINPPRKSYFNLIGAFSERGVTQFFADTVVKGKGKSFDPAKVPSFRELTDDAEPSAPAEPTTTTTVPTDHHQHHRSSFVDDEEVIVEDL